MLQIYQCGPPWKLIQSRPVDGPPEKEPGTSKVHAKAPEFPLERAKTMLNIG